jgi:hypothetical protein
VKGKGGWGDRDIETPGTSIHSETHYDLLLFDSDRFCVSEHSVTEAPLYDRRTALDSSINNQQSPITNQQSPLGDRVHIVAGRRVFARRNYWGDHRIKMRKCIETRR